MPIAGRSHRKSCVFWYCRLLDALTDRVSIPPNKMKQISLASREDTVSSWNQPSITDRAEGGVNIDKIKTSDLKGADDRAAIQLARRMVAGRLDVCRAHRRVAEYLSTTESMQASSQRIIQNVGVQSKKVVGWLHSNRHAASVL